MNSECSACKQWLLEPEDAFCGWCGARLSALQMTPARIVLFQDELEDNATHTVRLKNSGQNAARNIEISISTDWLDVYPASIDLIDAHSEAELVVRLITDAYPEGAEEARVTAIGEGVDATLVIELFPPLDLDFKLQGEAIALDGSEQPFVVEILAKSGEMELMGLESDAPWWDFKLRNHLPFPLSAARQNRVEVEVIVDSDKLRRAIEARSVVLQQTADGNFAELQFELSATNPPVALVTVPVQVCVPPRLRLYQPAELTRDESVYEVIERGLFSGQLASKRLGFANDGDRPLEILSVQVEGENGWLSVEGLRGSGPWIVASRKSQADGEAAGLSGFDIKLDMSDVEAGQKVTGDIRICTNSHPHPDITVRVIAEPQEMTPLHGYVAFDFGTTNSCLVWYDSASTSGHPQSAIVDTSSGREFTSAPSVVLYERLADLEDRYYDVGRGALARAAAAATSVVQSAKRFIGTDRKFFVRGFNTNDRQTAELAPEDVASDVIKRLISRAEMTIGHKISSCAITYPVKFDWQQIEKLKCAFEQSGVEVGVMVPEPVAAGLDYILGRGQQDDYSVLVCDLGGGTSDFSLFRVSWSYDDETEEKVVSPVLLGADTDNQFGGENVTISILEEMHEQAKAASTTEIPLVPPEDLQYSRNPTVDEYGVTNYARLRQAAERVKIELATNNDDSQVHEERLMLLDEDGKEVPVNISLTLEQMQQRVSHRFDFLVRMAKKIVDRAVEREQLDGVDVLLLTGNASQLPIVREVFGKAFSSARFADEIDEQSGADPHAEAAFRGTGLKECVARGACWNEMLEKMGGETRVDTDCYKVASMDLGVLMVGPPPVLKPVISVGEPLGEWREAGKFRSTLNVEIMNDAGGGLRRPVMRFTPQDYIPAASAVKVALMLTEQHEVRVQISAEGADPVIIDGSGCVCDEGNDDGQQAGVA